MVELKTRYIRPKADIIRQGIVPKRGSLMMRCDRWFDRQAVAAMAIAASAIGLMDERLLTMRSRACEETKL